MSNWNDDRLDEFSRRTDKSFSEVKAEMREGFAQVDQRFKKVDQEFKEVRQEMREGFAQTVTRNEMNERFTAVDKRLGDLTRWMQALVVVVGGAFVSNGLLG